MMSQFLISDMLLPVWVSIKLASITTLCLLLFATPLAYWLAKPSRGNIVGRIKILLMAIIAMPPVLPPTVIGFYLLLLLCPSVVIGQSLIHPNFSPIVFTFE